MDVAKAAMRVMQHETEIRMNPLQRAGRFIEDLQQLQQHEEERDSGFRGAWRASQSMQLMAESLECNPQISLVLVGRGRHELDQRPERRWIVSQGVV